MNEHDIVGHTLLSEHLSQLICGRVGFHLDAGIGLGLILCRDDRILGLQGCIVFRHGINDVLDVRIVVDGLG